jgi:hypothetical protein
VISKPERKTGAQDIKEFKLPGTKAEDNSSHYAIRALLTEDMKNIMVRRISNYTGISKARASSSALKFVPYMFEDYKNYGGEDPSIKMKGRQADEYQNSVRSVKDDFKKQKPDFVKESLGAEFKRRVLNPKFTLTADGRTEKKNVLVFSEEFEFPDFVRKAGKKYLVNLPALMGPQLQIKDEERTRKHDIDVRYPKKYSWSIEFKIPAGYKAEGLTDLNQQVDNETGGFSIKAKQENDLVILDIEKVYKVRNVSKTKWNDMLAFIDAAYASTFKYILLTPVK